MRSLLQKFAVVFLWILISILHAQAQQEAPAPQNLDELKAAIEKIRIETNTPAVGIALVDKNGPYWVASLGEANLEKHLKADENTMYRIGSVSKMFVSLAVLKLVEEGKLNLTDKVHDLAPDVQFDNPWEKTNPVLLVHLLEHTTGWDDTHFPERAYAAPDLLSLKDALAFHPDTRTSRWIPGTRMSYSNLGPVVAAYIIEKVTEEKYEDYVQKTFFEPLQMKTTTYFENSDYKKLGATLYSGPMSEEYLHMYDRPSGSINSNPKDMSNFLYFLIQRGKFNQLTIISQSSIDRMELPTTTLGSKVGVTYGYGLNNFTDGYKSAVFHGHDGGIPGALATLGYLKESQTGYVIMTNTANAALYQIQNILRDYLLRAYSPQKLDAIAMPQKFRALAGWYMPINPRSENGRFLSDPNSFMRITLTDDRLHISPLLNPWQSNHFALNENLLADEWSNTPSLAIVQDPLAGEVIQAGDQTLKKISILRVILTWGLIILFVFWSLTGFAFAIVWIPFRLFGKLKGGPSIQVRSWPLLASFILLFTCASRVIYGTSFNALGTVSPITLTLFIGSIVYALVSGWSFLVILKNRQASIDKIVYWHSAIFSFLNIMLTLYFMNYGIIGIRLWAI